MSSAKESQLADVKPPSIGLTDQPLIADRFDQEISAGHVIGSSCDDGHVRKGIDSDAVFAVDNGALRIAPLIEPGWSRACLAYGPLPRRAGLSLAVFMLNGHNTAQVEHLSDTLMGRLARWLRGSDTYGRGRRLLKWLQSGRMRRTFRTFWWWLHLRRGRKALQPLDENLTVGFFSDVAPKNPQYDSNAFIMHATGPDNGELWTTGRSHIRSVLYEVQNIPLHYVIMLREGSAAFYAASNPTSNSLPASPYMRPLSIEPVIDADELYAVIAQSTIGQIGFRIDSRVYGVRIAEISRFADWFGTAQVADSLVGEGELGERNAEVGGRWIVLRGSIERTCSGAVSRYAESVAIVNAPEPTGLIRAEIGMGAQHSSIALIWRWNPQTNSGLQFEIGEDRATLWLYENGVAKELDRRTSESIRPGAVLVLQVQDDGNAVRAYVDHALMLSAKVAPETRGMGVGVRMNDCQADQVIKAFEAHPVRVDIPVVLNVGGSKPLRTGTRVEVLEIFDGPAAALEGKDATAGGVRWRRLIGKGSIDLTGRGSAAVRGTPQQPNPGRTALAVDWKYPRFVDVQSEISIAGTRRGDGHKPRPGFIIWQDEDNYIIANIWRNDSYDGGSVSVFFQIDGFEDIYDAVWTNIGSRASFGDRVSLRVIFNGAQLVILLDGEPVLVRRLSDVYPHVARLAVNRVGLVANWEWGNDTGSIFHNFSAMSEAGADERPMRR